MEEIKNIWNDMAVDRYLHDVPLKKGVLPLIKELHAKGIKMGIASSNSIELVTAVVKRFELEQYFEVINTSCQVPKGKPAPDIYLLTAKDLQVKPEECLVFEDVVQGIQAGKSANMRVCAVEDAYSVDTPEEKAALADYYINSFTELKVEEVF